MGQAYCFVLSVLALGMRGRRARGDQLSSQRAFAATGLTVSAIIGASSTTPANAFGSGSPASVFTVSE
eukprot:2665221-Prymnesium_polylepis.2